MILYRIRFFSSFLSPLIFVIPSCVFYCFTFILPVVCFPFYLFSFFFSTHSLPLSTSPFLFLFLVHLSSLFCFLCVSFFSLLFSTCSLQQPPSKTGGVWASYCCVLYPREDGCVRPRNVFGRWLSRWQHFSPVSVIVVNFLQAFEK